MITVREVDEAELARDFHGKFTELINGGAISIQIIANTPGVDDAAERRFIVSDNIDHTPEGGMIERYINDTGASSVKGTVVEVARNAVDDAVDIAGTSSDDVIGVIYDDGVADGDFVWVVTQGKAQVLLEDGTIATRGFWVGTGLTTPGRADATSADPPGFVLRHFDEIGHCLETKGAGTDVLVLVHLHFN
jgi:hypothetical protein